MAIQIRRGDYTDFDPSQLLDGELAAVLENDPDTDDGTGLYVGFGDDNVKRVAFADETADVDVATTTTAGIVKPDGETITVDQDGTIHGANTTFYYAGGVEYNYSDDSLVATVGSDFKLMVGVSIVLWMTTLLSASTNPIYLNVNSTGKKLIKERGSNISLTNMPRNTRLLLVYNGSHWEIVGQLFRNSDKVLSGISTTSASNASKYTGIVVDGSPYRWQIVIVTFNYANTATLSNLNLGVVNTNGTNLVSPIRKNNEVLTEADNLKANIPYVFRHDGTYWQLLGTIPSSLPNPSDATPAMDGTASAGSSTDYARADHVHPTDTSRASASDLSSHTGNSNIHVTASDKANWDAKASTATATTSANGLMSSADKSKLDGMASGATANQASTEVPQMDGVADCGVSTDYARADHVHPMDTSRMAASLKGAANGVAELDASGKVPSSQLPSYVDDVLEYATMSAFPETGEAGKIYVVTSTNTTYRWSGSAYVSISNPLDYATQAEAEAGVENTHVMTPLRVKQAIDENAYELPAATTSALGGVKADGTTILVDADGTIHGAGELSVSVTADGNPVSGATIVVREGSASGAVVATYPYSGTPVAIKLPMGYHYCVTASDDLRMYGPPVPVTGVVGMLTQSITVTYSALSSVLVKEGGVYTNDSLVEFWRRQGDGRSYGTQMPKSTSTTCVKVGDNAGVADPVPSTLAQVGSDPYATGGLGPYLHYDVNGYVDADGTPHVTAIRGIDPSFALDGTNGNVWSMCPVLYERWDEDSVSVTWSVSDTVLAGYSPQPGAKLPDGTMRPYMLYAKYGGGMYDGAYASVSGVQIRNYDVSHNTLITITKSATTGYSGKSVADDWYLKMLWTTKYTSKDKQTYMQGCTGYNYQYYVTVAETGVSRVIISKANAANLVVGSSMMFGTRSNNNSDRGQATIHNIFSALTVTRIEDYDADNSAVYFDTDLTWDTATTYMLSTAPWRTGVTDGITYDGSPTSNASAKEPYVINGIEVAYGVYEVLSGVIISSDGQTGWMPHTVADTRKDATSLTSDFVPCGATLPDNTGTSTTWAYPTHAKSHNGLVYGSDTGGSTTSGLCDGHYMNTKATSGTREFLSLGHLSYARSAGPFSVGANAALSYAGWIIGGRLSATGRASAA